ncbi:MAG: histidinol dehydrogenase [Methylacidiphilales bacterium]|nr:histidinol dehydrogenase [Candidatus Methylacidiphilales bacterium]
MKVRILSTSQVNFKNYFNQQIILPSRKDSITVSRVVFNQIQQIKNHGDFALLKQVTTFDNWKPKKCSQLMVSKKEMDSAYNKLSPLLKRSLVVAFQRINAFAKKQKLQPYTLQESKASYCSQRIMPIERVGIYVPGGTASYPSTLLMNAIPARNAGVKKIVAVSPAINGVISPLVLATASMCGIDEMYKIGGASAIAALAYGTKTINPVDKITGPGNKYVTEAKRQVFGVVGIDMLAGPTEIVILFDAKSNPKIVALDLLAQAEHDISARAIGITTSMDQARQVQKHLLEISQHLSRNKIIQESFIRGSVLIVSRSINESLKLSNLIAPEHLHLNLLKANTYIRFITNAGAIFIGSSSAESFGDYCAGPNHVLPTNRSARFSSPLGTYDFQKRQNVVHLSARAAKELSITASTIAFAEGLEAHALSSKIRG